MVLWLSLPSEESINFWRWSGPDMDSGLIFALPPEQDILWNFSYSHRPFFSRNMAKWLMPTRGWTRYILGAIHIFELIRKYGNPYFNAGSLLVEVSAKWLALAVVSCFRGHLGSIFYRPSWHNALLIFFLAKWQYWNAVVVVVVLATHDDMSTRFTNDPCRLSHHCSE